MEGINIIGVALEEMKGETHCYNALKEVYDRVIDVDDMKHFRMWIKKRWRS